MGGMESRLANGEMVREGGGEVASPLPNGEGARERG
jgi:hypothetical protein